VADAVAVDPGAGRLDLEQQRQAVHAARSLRAYADTMAAWHLHRCRQMCRGYLRENAPVNERQ
jgi:hypothetical protein